MLELVRPGIEPVFVRLLVIELLFDVERLFIELLFDVPPPVEFIFIEFDIVPPLVVGLLDILDIVLLPPDVLFIVELLLLLKVLLLPVSDEQLPPIAAIVNTIDNVSVLLIEIFSFFY